MLDQFLAQQIGDNPQLQALLSLMQTQDQNNDVEIKREEIILLQSKLEKALAHIDHLRGHIQTLESVIIALENQRDDFAEAVGACTFCFGDDDLCRACRGKGKPGTFVPKSALYAQYVAPVIKKHPLENIFSHSNS